MSNKFDPNIRVEQNLDYKLELPFAEACDLSGDLTTVQEVAECILYVTQNQADAGGIELNNDDSDKWRYAEYYKACRTAMYLADYAVSFIDGLMGNIEVKKAKSPDFELKSYKEGGL